MAPESQDAPYTAAEVAELLRVGEPRVYELVASGQMPAIKLSERAIRIPRGAFQKWLDDEAFRQQAERRGPSEDRDLVEALAALPAGRRANGFPIRSAAAHRGPKDYVS